MMPARLTADLVGRGRMTGGVMVSKGIFHVNIVVRDLERSIRFYSTVFGFVDSGMRDGHLAFLTTSGSGDDLLSLDFSPEAQDKAGVMGGLNHFGIRVEDMDYDKWAATVVEHGGSVVERGTFPGGIPSLYVGDPDGYVIAIQGPFRNDKEAMRRTREAMTPS
jgi:catechol 2,3-dioxygenase-like lactoylglutathione lyase family enzyme